MITGKNTLVRMNRGLQGAQEWMSDLKDEVVEGKQTEQKKEFLKVIRC